MTTNRAKKTKEQQTSVIYVGPTSKQIQKYTVFRADPPEHVKKFQEACPAIKQLFVPVEQLAEAENRLADKTSAESIFYAEAEKFVKEVK